MKVSYEVNECRVFCELAHGISEYLPSFHHHVEILQVVEGELNITIDGKNTTLTPGDMSICFPLTIHSNQSAENALVNFIFFTPDVCPSFIDILQTSQLVSPFIKKESVPSLLNELILKAISPGDFLCNERRIIYLNAIISEILSKFPLSTSPNLNTNIISSVISYCSKHFDEDISLQRISKALYLAPKHISYIFTNKLKCSFRSYINTLRIERAKQLLKNPHSNITDIIFECGYKNQSTFNRVFKNLCGLTPYQYRNQFLKNNDSQ